MGMMFRDCSSLRNFEEIKRILNNFELTI
jgi:hypothetical protein